ncbi:MAG: polysaccharide deacetylase family protein, partial [Candidatus Thioglobus sp.]
MKLTTVAKQLLSILKLNIIKSALALTLLITVTPAALAASTQAIVPDEQYIMITFDDGIRVEDFTELKALASNSAIRMTYFLTNGYQINYALAEWWYTQGHEIANHITTPGTPAIPQGKGAIAKLDDYKTMDWNREYSENKTLINYWSNIPEDEITGTRRPFLLKNTAQYDPQYKAAVQSSFYDSSMTHDVDSDRYNTKPLPNGCYKISDNDDKLNVLCEPIKENGDKFYNVRMPALGKLNSDGSRNAMLVPDISDICKLLNNNKNNKIPIMIALHTAVFKSEVEDWTNLASFIGDPVGACADHTPITQGLTPKFVTVKEVVEMYSNGNTKVSGVIKERDPLRCNVFVDSASNPSLHKYLKTLGMP